LTGGEEQIFKFVEIVFSTHPVESMEDGIAGRYFVGMTCLVDRWCDFKKASPIPPAQFTPAKTIEQLFLQ